MKNIVRDHRNCAPTPWTIQLRLRCRIASAACLALLLLPSLASPRAWAAASVDDLTGPWQLLVDDYPVASKTNVVRTYHPFQKYTNNPVLVADQPWEQPMVYLYGTVLPNETHTGYRMWYHCLRTNNSICTDWSTELYATSTNGINWVKPVLNLRETCGSTSNNMYYTRPTGGGMTSVMQTPWDPDPAQRYKFMNKDDVGYYAGWSPDGINVTDAPDNPVFAGGSDVGQFCWDPHTQLYRGYVKNSSYDGNGLKRRAVALTTTTDITSWPQESLIFWPDAFDDRWVPAGTIQRTHFYGLSAFPYESMYLGFLWIFRATDVDGYYIGPCFVELVSSHDGVQWAREEGNRPPILPLGATNTWDDGMIFTARAPIVEGNTIKLWYGGFNQVHGSALTKTTGSIGLATLRKDGFASLDATTNTGTVLTKPLTNAGGALQVNYRAVGGSLKVEVLDQNGNVFPGYSQANCTALTSDSVTQAVTWAAHTVLPAGAPLIRLKFILQNAWLYSFMAGQSAALVDVPTITQQPANQLVATGGSAGFTVVASAVSPLNYQWQKNQADLADGGPYSGCTTPTLTVTQADSADAAIYRCVVTNAYGAVTSNPAWLVVATNAFGSVALTNIPTLPDDTTNDARAITPDGAWVVGISGARGFLHAVNTTNVFIVITPENAQASVLTGVGYRTENGQKEIIMSGLSAGWYTDFMTTNGTAFGSKRRDVSLGKAPAVPVANGLAGTASDTYYSMWLDVNTSGYTEYVGKLFGAWPMSTNAGTVLWDRKTIPSTNAHVHGVSSTGRVVGWRNSPSENYVLDWNGTGTPTPWFFNGLNGTTRGEAFCVSADGLIVFGQSPILVGDVTNNCGYKVVNPGASQTIAQLPNCPGTVGSASLAVPYGCTADGKYAVGMNYRSIEKAALWDTSDPNPAKWTVTDLTDLAVANGTADIFARLVRAYSVGTNTAGNLVIAGVGLDTNSPANTRAFVMTLPPQKAPVVSRPTVTLAGSYPGGFTFSFLTVLSVNVTYYLDYTTNLTPPSTWTTIASTPGTGGRTSLSDPNPSDSRRFYRIRVQ